MSQFASMEDRGQERLVSFVPARRQDAHVRLPSRRKSRRCGCWRCVSAWLFIDDIRRGGEVDSGAAGIDSTDGAGDVGALDPVDTEVY